MESRDEDNLYVNGIRQIIANIGPVLKLSWSASAAEEILLNLEATDENFHKYDLVRLIKSRIEKEIGPLVDNLVDHEKFEMQDHRIFPVLNEAVACSPEYNRLSLSVLNSVRTASEKVLQTIYDNQDYPLSSGTEVLTRNSHNWISSNDIESMLSSSFEGDLMFASLERYEKISSDLKPTNTRALRLDAFNCLYQMPQSDIATSENWHVIKDRISSALSDVDDVIAEKSLRFHARMFASGSSHLTREIFFSLCQNLISSFHTMHFQEVDLNDEMTVRILNQIRLLNQFQHYLPLCWIRFPEKIVQELVRYTMDLLSINTLTTKNKDEMYNIGPVQFLALVDPKAQWFKKWMHGHHSRASLLKRLEEDSDFLCHLCDSILDFYSHCKSFAKKSYQKLLVGDQNEERASYSLAYLKYAVFVHATNIIEHLLLFKRGRETFPLQLVGNKDFDLKSLFVILVEILLLTNTSVNAMFMDTRLVHPGLIITSLIKTIAKSSSAAALLCDDDVINALLRPLQEFMKATTTVATNRLSEFEGTLIVIADILSFLANTKCGREHLLYGSFNKKWSLPHSSPAFVIADFTQKVLLGNLSHKPLKGVLDAYLFICRQLYVTGEGLFILRSFNLSKYLCSALEKLKKEYRVKNSLTDEKRQLFALRNQELLQLASHPKVANYLMDVSPPASTSTKYKPYTPESSMDNLFDNYHRVCHKGCMEISHEVGGRYDIEGLPFCGGSNDFSSIKILFSSLLNTKEDFAFHEMSLLDSLLSFAMTPKGVLLIQQNGCMSACMKYLYTRQRHGFQVSKIERYGYGVLFSQLSATGPGILAIENAGYIKDLLEDIWDFLEGGSNDYYTPILPVYNEDMDERHCQKLFCSLVNILSSFPSVPELINKHPMVASTPDTNIDEPLTSATAPPTPLHLQDFLNQVVLLDSDYKIKLLYHFDFTHLFGLRVLSCMICCLDTALLLETRYRYQEILLELQADFQPEKGLFMIDACSLERNQILVRSFVTGGFHERSIPPRNLPKDSSSPFKWPLFSSFPAPEEYSLLTTNRTRITSGSEDFIRYLSSNENPEDATTWLSDLRRDYANHYSNESAVGTSRSSVKHVLSRVCLLLAQVKDNIVFHTPQDSGADSVIRGIQLTDIETSGIELVLRYGIRLGVIRSMTDAREGLRFIYRRYRWYSRNQQRSTKSDAAAIHADYTGFDWFLGTIFLIYEGNIEDASLFLQRFLSIAPSGYLWPARLHMLTQVATSGIKCGIHPIYSSVCHNVQLILQTELPQVYSAIRMSGYTSSQICQLWLRQCFWNYLDWDEICTYISTCLVMGIDYQVYFCVCIFQHLEKDILCHSQQKDLVVFLKEESIKYFYTAKYIKSMVELEERYRKIVLTDLMEGLK